MGKITLSEALKKATIENNLQNYLGLNADGALGKMTPERLASVVGGLKYVREYKGVIDFHTIKEQGVYYLNGVENSSNMPKNAAQYGILEVLVTPKALIQRYSTHYGTCIYQCVLIIAENNWSRWAKVNTVLL